jgi:hypothetical protein
MRFVIALTVLTCLVGGVLAEEDGTKQKENVKEKEAADVAGKKWFKGSISKDSMQFFVSTSSEPNKPIPNSIDLHAEDAVLKKLEEFQKAGSFIQVWGKFDRERFQVTSVEKVK